MLYFSWHSPIWMFPCISRQTWAQISMSAHPKALWLNSLITIPHAKCKRGVNSVHHITNNAQFQIMNFLWFGLDGLVMVISMAKPNQTKPWEIHNLKLWIIWKGDGIWEKLKLVFAFTMSRQMDRQTEDSQLVSQSDIQKILNMSVHPTPSIQLCMSTQPAFKESAIFVHGFTNIQMFCWNCREKMNSSKNQDYHFDSTCRFFSSGLLYPDNLQTHQQTYRHTYLHIVPFRTGHSAQCTCGMCKGDVIFPPFPAEIIENSCQTLINPGY